MTKVQSELAHEVSLFSLIFLCYERVCGATSTSASIEEQAASDVGANGPLGTGITVLYMADTLCLRASTSILVGSRYELRMPTYNTKGAHNFRGKFSVDARPLLAMTV